MTVNIYEDEVTHPQYGGEVTTRIKNDAYDIVLSEELTKKIIKTSPLLKRCLVELYGGEK